jgi:hypothetical protein
MQRTTLCEPSFSLTMLSHAGEVHVDLKVTPEVIGIFGGSIAFASVKPTCGLKDVMFAQACSNVS